MAGPSTGYAICGTLAQAAEGRAAGEAGSTGEGRVVTGVVTVATMRHQNWR